VEIFPCGVTKVPEVPSQSDYQNLVKRKVINQLSRRKTNDPNTSGRG